MLKIYSDKTKQYYDTEAEAQEAEAVFDKKQNDTSKATEEKKAAAKEVEDAYKHMLDVDKQASKMIDDAKTSYYEAREKFINKYGSFHMTYSSNNGKEYISVSDVLDALLGNW
jgi:acetyl-CoA carboxylase carboxyltransferase component